MRARYLIVVLSCALALSCSKKQGEHREEKPAPAGSTNEDESEREALPSKVRIADSVIADAKIRTAPATREPLALVLSLPGELAADPDKSARVSSPVAGRIERVDFKEGSQVKKGDLLAQIKIPELGKLRAESSAAGAKAQAARSNADRLRALREQRFASDQDVLNAEAEARALEEESRGLQEQIAAFGGGGGASTLSLRAPVSGVVLSRDAIVGQPVTAEQTIASIADLSELWFLGRVFEKDLARLHVGAQAEVTLNAYPGERFLGAVEYVGRQIDPGSRTVTARVRLTNRDDVLKVGLFGTARVATGEHEAPALVVPTDAIADIAGNSVVFVRQPDGAFEVHPVTPGRIAPGKTEILSGLREGAEVVVEGVFTVKSAVLKSTFGEEE